MTFLLVLRPPLVPHIVIVGLLAALSAVVAGIERGRAVLPSKRFLASPGTLLSRLRWLFPFWASSFFALASCVCGACGNFDASYESLNKAAQLKSRRGAVAQHSHFRDQFHPHAFAGKVFCSSRDHRITCRGSPVRLACGSDAHKSGSTLRTPLLARANWRGLRRIVFPAPPLEIEVRTPRLSPGKC